MTTEHPFESIRPSAEEEALLAVLDGADPFTEGGAPGADPSDLETLGQLASLVEARVSSEELVSGKAALFARLKLGQAGALQDSAGTVRHSAKILPLRRGERSPSPRSGLSAWAPLALAATVFLAVGLGAWSGFLFSELSQMRTLVAGLESELDERSLGGSGTDDFQQVLFENRRLRQQIGFSTRPKTRVCALSAITEQQPKAKATVFLHPEDHEWVIATSNLAKCPLGRRYRVWFLGEGGAVMGSAQLDHVNGEEEFETASGQLPDGATSVLVTLEFPEDTGEQPGGERILYGDRSVEIY